MLKFLAGAGIVAAIAFATPSHADTVCPSRHVGTGVPTTQPSYSSPIGKGVRAPTP